MFSYSSQSKSAFDVHLDEWVLSWPQLHLCYYTWHPGSLSQRFWVNLYQRSHLWLGCWTCIPEHWICLNPNLQVDKVGWSNQTIPCSFWAIWLESSLGQQVCTQMMSYLMLSLSKTVTIKRFDVPVLSNSGNLKSRILTTCCILRWPVRVFTSLVSPRNFVIIPLGKANI